MTSTFDELAELGVLLEKFRPKLLAMAERRLPLRLAGRVGAEDILSEVFLVAKNRYRAFRKESSLSAYSWLYRITKDCIIEAWRRETRGLRNVEREVPWPEQSSIHLGLQLIDSGTSPSQGAVRQEAQERIKKVLAQLKPTDQDALWMRHCDQLSFKEAAEILEISEAATTLRYHRALRRLRELWNQIEQNEQ